MDIIASWNLLRPVCVGLILASTTIILSNSLKTPKKLFFQGLIFAIALISSFLYLASIYDNSPGLQAAVIAFGDLESEVRLVITIFIIGLTYFVGGMYLGYESVDVPGGAAGVMPASCDKATTFHVPATLPETDKEVFEEIFDRICEEIVADLPTVYEMPEEAVNWVDRMLKYTVAGGKMNRGLALMSVQQTLAGNRKLSNKERVQSAALGWCIEFLQAFFLVADDVMDDSVTRRGQPCWFRNDDVRLIAVNDSFILESCVYKILKRYFGAEREYSQLLDLFIEVTRQTELGQLLDLTSQPLGQPMDLNRFTMERLTSIFKYKTAFYSFYLPVALGMILSGVTDVKLFDKAREILCIMGEYFQIQDDFLDCYGTPEVIGKVGTDIQDAKCSWMVVTALGKCSKRQRTVIEQNYGRHEDKCIKAIKKLYDDLNLRGEFEAYEEDSYKNIQQLLDESSELPREVFEFLLRKIYKRKK